MPGTQNQSWVTSILTNDDVNSGLILCQSLRQTFTNRKITAIVSQNLKNEFRKAVRHAFDVVYLLEEFNGTKQHSVFTQEEYAKLYSIMALGTFSKAVYLAPSILALQNIDDIFDVEFKSFALLEDVSDTSVFAFIPSLHNYEALNQSLKSSTKPNLGQFLKSWGINNQSCQIPQLDTRFSTYLKKGSTFPILKIDMPAVNLAEFSTASDVKLLENVGLQGKLISNCWHRINTECTKYLSKFLETEPGILDLNLPSKYANEPIAIVGISCRFPGSNNLKEFWRLLNNGEDGTCNPPEFRWKREQSYRQVPGARDTNAGFLKVPVDEFDAKFFGISPKEALFLDPQHRLLLELVWESLEDSCTNPLNLRGTEGSVFIGSWINDYKEILINSGNDEFYRVYMGNSIGACAARISFMLGMIGPSVATESGCSSAMVAVHMACQSLRLGETNMALACGVNLLLHPFDKDDLPMAVSPDGRSKTFSEDANGFARAEGAGVLVLKRLSDAVRNGDRIWGLIRGTAITQEGLSKSMGTPTVHSESQAMEKALRNAQVAPEQISYVETHGTGTVVGDPMEIAAIAKAYHTPNRVDPLIIGSVKTNIGHTESCSGITGIIKVILCMQHETIPAHLNFTKLNPLIDLTTIPAEIPLEKRDWKICSSTPRLAGVSSFGITGTDAHVIIEEPPSQRLREITLESNTLKKRPLHLLKLSAKTEEAINLYIEKYLEWLPKAENDIADICFSANMGRADFPIRRILIAGEKEEFVHAMKNGKFLKGDLDRETNVGKICFLFTGQGSQYSNMAKELYTTNPVFQTHFDYCAKLLKDSYSIQIDEIMWSSSSSNEISRTIYSQTSIFCIQYALLKLWETWGVKPDYVLGHSLGEFAAAVCANLLSLDNAIKLVAERSILIDALPTGKMLVIKTDKDQVDQLLLKFAAQHSNTLDFAAVNSPQQTVVAGDSHVVEMFSELCKENGIQCMFLQATQAFHSRHMNPILEKYRQIAKSLDLPNKTCRNSKCGYISGMQGKLLEPELTSLDAEYWVQHTREPVNFLKASQTAVKLGCSVFIEVGPQPILSALTMMNNDVPLRCLGSLKKNESNWQTLLSSLGQLYVMGTDINWAGFDKLYSRNKVGLPHYPFIRKKIWPDMMQVQGKLIHPLLGSAVSNASSSKIFQNGVNLRVHEWIKDHAIGNRIILPAAAYLEMCVAAGYLATQGSMDIIGKPVYSIKIENCQIQNPLQMKEDTTTQMQTIVEYKSQTDNMEIGTIIKIFHRREIDGWLCHATATFSPIVDSQDTIIPFDIVDIGKVTSALEINCKLVSDEYKKFAMLGLNFGSKFQSIEKLWKTGNAVLAKIKIPNFEAGLDLQFVVHPVILDAMIQAILMANFDSNFKHKLYVPIRIGKLIWLSTKTSSSDLYIQICNNTPANLNLEPVTSYTYAILLTALGETLAIMQDVEFISTTVGALEAVIEQQVNPVADTWKEEWRRLRGPCEEALSVEHLPKQLSVEEKRQFKKYNECSESVSNTLKDVNKLVYYNMLRALYKCGWRPSAHINESFAEDELLRVLNIKQTNRKQFGYFFRVFEEEGIVERHGDHIWRLSQQPPTPREVDIELSKSLYKNELVQNFRSTLLISKIGQHLAEILTGSYSILGILFPEERGEPSAADFYYDYGQLLDFEPLVRHLGEFWFKKYKSSQGEKSGLVRVLEVGAGTGGYTQASLQVLDNCDMKFEYTYTDISPAFFGSAEKRFEKWAKDIKFRKLNIEEDPLAQGFVPGYYDVICAADVIHATKNLRQTLQNIRTLLKPGGFFDLCEQISVNRFITYMFGFLEGFWRFEDFDVRPDHCTVSSDTWSRLLEETGFEVVGVHPSAQGLQGCVKSRRCINLPNVEPQKFVKTWIVFHEPGIAMSEQLIEHMKNLATYRKLVLVTHDSSPLQNVSSDSDVFTIRPNVEQDYVDLMNTLNANYTESVEGIVYCWSLSKVNAMDVNLIIQPYFLVAKSLRLLKQAASARFCALVQGTAPVEDNDLSGFYAHTLCGFTRCLQNEHANLRCKIIDIGPQDTKYHSLQTFFEIWSPQEEHFVTFQGGCRYVPKLLPMKITNNSLELPTGSVDRFQLILPNTNSIQDLKFDFLNVMDLNSNEIEVEIRASALNFRDVMSVLKPSEFFKNLNAVGFDLAGIIKRVGSNVTRWKVGDRVYGVNADNTALPSHIKLCEDAVLKIPDNLTFCDACTIPAVVATSHHCLITVANIKPTDIVLIHTASGGVGLSAIEICNNIGATIIATAGSKRKQNYLRNLGIQHIFHSRNTEFADEILKVTGGRGVDVVLNSLTSEGFKEASLRACAKDARFVEMSKLSIWTLEEVKRLRPDVKYTVVDLTNTTLEDWYGLLENVEDLIQQRVLNPIAYTRFDALDIRQALTYMQKAKHIGKIVCVMPEIKRVSGVRKVHTPLFYDNSTYLITGGLGGIGFEICKWMLKMGAKHILLAGRNPPNPTLQQTILNLNTEMEAKVTPVVLDVSNFTECENLVQNVIPNLGYPNLRGIMHAAGTLYDAIIENHTWTTFASTFPAKIKGTYNLHMLTKNMPRLEHFVLFSSAAALFGSPGQSNHAAANSFEDALAHYRHSIGLTATTINWGQWGEVGVATEVIVPGIKPFSTKQAITALEHAIKNHHTQLGVVNIESVTLFGKLLPFLHSYIDERVWKSTMGASKSEYLAADVFWKTFDEASSVEEKLEILKNALRSILRQVLKLEDTETIDDTTNFQEMGVDSLMFVEIKNALQSLLGDRVTVNASTLKDCNTLNMLSSVLVKIIQGDSLTELETATTIQEVEELVQMDCVLPDHIASKPDQHKTNHEDISCVLLTGVTGTLGPYILKELCKFSQVKQIICLIRPHLKYTAEKRLESTLLERGMISQINQKKITCVLGNLAEPKLAIDEHQWDKLCNNVDAIIHCATKAQHSEQYKKRDSKNDTRAVNVQGLKHVLEFACTGSKLKHVYCASSIAATAKPNKIGKMSEDWSNPEDFNGVTTMAYPISKFVGDVLMKTAVLDRGIPGKVFRFPLIVGDSKTGQFTLDQNHLMLRYLFILKMGIMPSNPAPVPLLPVDICAKVSLQLFFNPQVPDDVYNVYNKTASMDQDFVSVAQKLGYNVQIVNFSEFAQKIRESTPQDSPFAMFKEFYKSDEDLMSLYNTAPLLKQWLINGASMEDFFSSAKVRKYLPEFYEDTETSMDCIYRDLLFAKSQGWMEKYTL